MFCSSEMGNHRRLFGGEGYGRRLLLLFSYYFQKDRLKKENLGVDL